MYQAVLFDMDGVIADTERSIVDFWQELARAEGLSLSADELERHVHGRQAEHTLRMLFPHIPADRYDEVYRRLRENNQTLRYSAIPGAVELVRQLSDGRIPLALVTGAEPWKVTAVLGQLGLNGLFNVQVHAGDVESGKPDPSCYRLAARRLGVGIGRSLVFEDAVSGVTSAVTAGASCVALAPPSRARQVLDAGATHVVRDLSDVRLSGLTLRIDAETELAFARPLFAAPVDRWDPDAAGLSGRDEVIFRSHLVGADPALTKEGGGNFSAKGTVPDHLGRPTRVLWMSAWGCDGATTTAEDFPALRLDELLSLRDPKPVSEREMVEYLVACGMLGEQRRPGIETLTHAFIPAKHVDHCHPDAVIALTSFPGGRERAEAEFGDEAIWFDYRQFDVDVARELADRIEAGPRCRFVLLANHGLFTWADTSEQCYRNSLEAVARATKALGEAIHRPADLGGPAVTPLPEESATAVLTEILPVLRGALGMGILHVDRGPDAVEFASSERGPRLSRLGPGCPDHLGTVGYRPLVLLDGISAREVLDGVERHRKWYDAYCERHATPSMRALERRDSAPRVVVLPGIGVVSAGTDAAKARLCSDHFGQTMTVIRAADAAGGYVSLSEAQGVADEYWPLIRLKPQLRAASGRLAGKVFLVSGPDDGHAVEIADHLAAEDAHVALAVDDPGSITGITRRYGERRVVAVSPGAEVREAVLAYGGFDALITVSARLAAAALPVFACQDRGGSVLLAGSEWIPGDLRTGEVIVNAAATTSPDAIAEAAAFFAASDIWQGTVLQPCRPREEKVA